MLHTILMQKLLHSFQPLPPNPILTPTRKHRRLSFLCLNHTFLSYIAALGAHREKIEDPRILSLLDQALDDIQGALLTR